MLYNTVVQRDETGLNQICEAVRAFEEENVMEAIIGCKFDYKKLDQTRLTVRHYNGHLFDSDAYDERLQTLAHELAAFFYHLLTTLQLCKDMIRKEEQVLCQEAQRPRQSIWHCFFLCWKN